MANGRVQDSGFSIIARRCSIGKNAQPFKVLLVLLVAFVLSSCMLASGEVTSADTPAAGGNVSVSFVSAEGADTRSLNTGRAGTLNVITIVSADQGSLTVELLDPSNSVIYAVTSRPGEPVTKSGSVATDSSGQVRYRVSATGARNGNYQILYQRTG